MCARSIAANDRVKINFTDSGLSLWCIKITIPMTVPDVQDVAFQVLHLKRNCFLDTKP